VIKVSVVVGREGRLVLPKELREKYRVREGSRLIVRDYGGRIVLIPVVIYESPTEALHGSVQLKSSVEEPKEVARRHVRKKLLEGLG
jgi:AbrB family looped-hinge helix DNA binding protein